MPVKSSRRGSLGRLACKWALGGVVVLALGRAFLYVAYLVCRFSTPLEAYDIEAKMVHLAWRVQHGQHLYPSWHSGPYVANFFGPIYFILVGFLGKAAHVGLDGLFSIARGVTVASSVALTLLLGVYTGRRYGMAAGIVAAIVSVGSAPMIGFGVMARPDALADLFGCAGFLLAVVPTRRGRASGSILLLLAIFTKQTAAVYLVAACLANVWNGRNAAALGIGAVVILSALAIVATVTLSLEPEFGSGLVGELGSPRDMVDYQVLLKLFGRVCPDLAICAVIGLILWGLRPTRDLSFLALVIVLVTTSLATSVKKGAGLNYYLSLRAVEALALATLWSASKNAEGARAWWFAALATIVGVSLMPAVADVWTQADSSIRQRDHLRSRIGQGTLRQLNDLIRLCRDPDVRILTDSSFLDIQQGSRTAFGDSWLFRLLANTHRLEPTAMKRAVEEEHYDWILTTNEINDGVYQEHSFGLPMSVIEAARRHYVPTTRKAGFFRYRPRGRAAP